jgi:hypothetical protein
MVIMAGHRRGGHDCVVLQPCCEHNNGALHALGFPEALSSAGYVPCQFFHLMSNFPLQVKVPVQ